MREGMKSSKAAEAFVALLGRRIKAEDPTEIIGTADYAVEVLWSGKALGHKPGRDALPGESWRDQLDPRLFAQARRELLRATEGQPFRIDTDAGPLFALVALWEFAGRSGEEFHDELAPSRRERPKWRSAAVAA